MAGTTTALAQDFGDFARSLNLDSETQTNAWALVEKLYSLPLQQVPQRDQYPANLFFASAVYLSSTKPGLSVSQLLAPIGAKVADLFTPAEIMVGALFQDEARKAKSTLLKYLQTQYLVTTLIYRKYVDVFDQYFIRSEQNPLMDLTQPNKKRSSVSDSDRVFIFGWLLFLVARSKLIPPNTSCTPDYFRSLQILVCCLDVLLSYAPSNMRKVDLNLLLAQSGNTDEEQDTLKLLCTSKELQYSLMKPYQDSTFLPFLVSNCGVQSQGTLLVVQGVLTDGDRPHFVGLLDPPCIEQNVKSLMKEYEEQLRFGSCNFDERQLPPSPTPGEATPSRTSQSSTHLGTTGTPVGRQGYSMTASPAVGVSRAAPTATPARMTVHAVSWLMSRVSSPLTPATNAKQNEGSSSSEEEEDGNTVETCRPSPRLLELCNAVGVGREAITSRALVLIAKVNFPTDNETRKTQAMKLYYRILENILILEESNQRAYATLVNNDKFHKAVLAASLEIVLCSYNVMSAPELEFPHFINAIELKPFDFGKVIESVIRAEPGLPRVVVKHLVTIEERILESLAWQSDSPLWFALDQGNVRQLLLQRLQSTGTPNKPCRSACEVFTSPHRPNGQRQGNVMLPVELFFRKVSHLASLRIHKLCGDLQKSDAKMQITDKLVKQIEYAFLHIATQTELLLNRHIDQIIMAIFYALCKVSMPQTPITFKALIEKYNNQPQARPAVYRYVKLGPGEGEDDIIKFYNKVFLPSAQPFILKFQLPPGASADESNADETIYTGPWRSTIPNSPGLTPLTATPQPPRSPSQKIGNSNLFISPLKPTASSPLSLGKMSTTAKISYQFGMSPQKSLGDINRSVNATRDNGPRKRLVFDDSSSVQ